MGNESNGHKATRQVYSKTMEMAMMRMLKKTQRERKQKVISVPRPLLEAKSAKGVECVLQQEKGHIRLFPGILHRDSVTLSHWGGRQNMFPFI